MNNSVPNLCQFCVYSRGESIYVQDRCPPSFICSLVKHLLYYNVPPSSILISFSCLTTRFLTIKSILHFRKSSPTVYSSLILQLFLDRCILNYVFFERSSSPCRLHSRSSPDRPSGVFNNKYYRQTYGKT